MTLVFSQEHEQLLPILCLVCLTPEEIEEALVLPFTDLTDEFLLERLGFMQMGGNPFLGRGGGTKIMGKLYKTRLCLIRVQIIRTNSDICDQIKFGFVCHFNNLLRLTNICIKDSI